MVNWERIIAISGLTLCTTMVATGFNATPAIINAVLMAGIAGFTEMKLETEKPLRKVQKFINTGMII